MKIKHLLIQNIHAMWQRKGLMSTLLLPLSWIVRIIIAYKQRRYRCPPTTETKIPIIVVGNLVVGGTGKTPVVIALVNELKKRGWHPGVISRGYGVSIKGNPRVGQGKLTAQEFGDEPTLIASSTTAPIAVHPKRTSALQALVNAYPLVDLIIADDGLQHLALRRDVEIVVQDARGIGNGRVIPAGPLREPARKLATVAVVITNLALGQAAPKPLPIAAAQIIMRLHPDRVVHLASGQTLSWPQWHTQHAAATIDALAAIGQPERFFSMLRACNLTLTKTRALPDHDAFTESPFTTLRSDIILITAKDAVKCTQFQDPRIWIVHVTPQFSDTAWLDNLNSALSSIAAKKQKK